MLKHRVLFAVVFAATLAMNGVDNVNAMPVKAKPVEYVKICSLYGAGYYYIPGTDTCLKIGGFVMGGNYEGWCQTGWGTPSYVPGWIAIPAYTGAFTNPFGNTINSSITNDNFYRGLIQWGGFTPGKSTSYFDWYNPRDFAYTYNTNQTRPDIVGNIRLDQQWGSAQISGGNTDTTTTNFNGGSIGTGLKLNSPMLDGGYRTNNYPIIGDYLKLGSGYGASTGNIFGVNSNVTGVTSGNDPSSHFGTIEDGRGDRWKKLSQENWGRTYTDKEFENSDGSTSYYSAWTNEMGQFVEKVFVDDFCPICGDPGDSYTVTYTYDKTTGRIIGREITDYGYHYDHVSKQTVDSNGRVHTEEYNKEVFGIVEFGERFLSVSTAAVLERQPSIAQQPDVTRLEAYYQFWRAPSPESGDLQWSGSTMEILTGTRFNPYSTAKFGTSLELGLGRFNAEKIFAPGFLSGYLEYSRMLGVSPGGSSGEKAASEKIDSNPQIPQFDGNLPVVGDLLATPVEEEHIVASSGASARASAEVPVTVEVATNLAGTSGAPANQKSRDKGNGPLPPAKPTLVLKLFTNKATLPIRGGARPTDIGFDQDPAECVVAAQGKCSITISAADRRFYGLAGSEPVYKANVDMPNSTSIIWREEPGSQTPTLESVRARMPSLPPEARVRFREFSIGDKKFTQAMVETATYNPAPDRWKAYLQPASKPKSSNRGGGTETVTVIVQDDCGNKLPAPYGDGQPFPSSIGSRDLPQATIEIPHSVRHRS